MKGSDFKAAYRTIMDDHFPPGMELSFVDGDQRQTLVYEKVSWIIDDVAASDPGQLKYYGGAVFNTLSHGQGILAYLRGRFKIPGLYLLDEPEAALSPRSQVDFLRVLRFWFTPNIISWFRRFCWPTLARKS